LRRRSAWAVAEMKGIIDIIAAEGQHSLADMAEQDRRTREMLRVWALVDAHGRPAVRQAIEGRVIRLPIVRG